MKHRTAVIVAALVLLICARMPAWSQAASRELHQAVDSPHALREEHVGLHVEWEPASILGRRLGTICGMGRELSTWL